MVYLVGGSLVFLAHRHAKKRPDLSLLALGFAAGLGLMSIVGIPILLAAGYLFVKQGVKMECKPGEEAKRALVGVGVIAVFLLGAGVVIVGSWVIRVMELVL